MTGMNKTWLFETLMDREQIGSTGIGYGIAIPHIKCSSLDDVHGILVRLDEPIDYDAIDDAPVDLVFFLLAPENARGAHLRALAEISSLFHDPDMRRTLRHAENDMAITTALNDWSALREAEVA